MKIASANLFCLNPRPKAALEAIAEQKADLVVLIESTPRFDAIADAVLPPRRFSGRTRLDGMPVSIHAKENVEITDAREDGHGWLEATVGALRLIVVHAVAPYLPWRIPRRAKQLTDLATRMKEFRDDEAGLVIGDFNTADFEPTWARYEQAAAPWRRIDCAHHGPGPGPARGTWPLGGKWSPVALDHALATPTLADHSQTPARVTPFRIPWSDHKGLTVDLPPECVEP